MSCAFYARYKSCLGICDISCDQFAIIGSYAAFARGLHPWEPMLEFDTTENIFRDKLLKNPLNIQQQVKQNKGRVMIPMGPGLGVEPDPDFIAYYEI